MGSSAMRSYHIVTTLILNVFLTFKTYGTDFTPQNSSALTFLSYSRAHNISDWQVT